VFVDSYSIYFQQLVLQCRNNNNYLLFLDCGSGAANPRPAEQKEGISLSQSVAPTHSHRQKLHVHRQGTVQSFLSPLPVYVG
jgi:hypothetical protein